MQRTIRLSGLDRILSAGLARWRGGQARHDPAKVLIDLATAVALGGDCAANIAVVRAQPQVCGAVASDPTVSRLIAALAADIDVALPAIRAARAAVRQRVWARRRPLAGTPGRRDGGLVVVDIDSTVVSAHSDKEGAQPTFKRTFGFVPMCAFVDHGEHGTGETLIAQLRPGKASPWAKTDHIQVLDAALAQLPAVERSQVLVRADSGACSKAFLRHITDAGLEYSIGFAAHETVKVAIDTISGPCLARRRRLRRPDPRRGTGRRPHRVDAHADAGHPTRPEGLARRDAGHRPPGTAPPRRATTSDRPRRLADHLLRHQHQRAGLDPGRVGDPPPAPRRAEDRIRALKDTGMRNLPYHGYHHNQIWLEIVALTADLLAWTQTLAWNETEPGRRWEPKRLRLRILAVAGRIIRTGRQRRHTFWTPGR